MSRPPEQAAVHQARVAELCASRPYDGRRVTLQEDRGGWKYIGLSGVCTRLSSDERQMVLMVEQDPEDYWPVGIELLVDLDHETVPLFVDYS